MKITRNPRPRQVLVSQDHQQEPKPYFLFHSLFQPSTELTLGATTSSSTPEDEVSTALTLGWGVPSLTIKKRKALDQNPADDPPITPKRQELLLLNIAKREERDDEDTDMIKKRLTVSDTEDHVCRLLMPKSLFKNHLLHYWDDELFQRVLRREGARFIVHDCDTRTNHGLTLKYWKNVNAYVFNKKWGRFVKRRGLRKNDEIGLCWDAPNSRFMFSVLGRANQPAVHQQTVRRE